MSFMILSIQMMNSIKKCPKPRHIKHIIKNWNKYINMRWYHEFLTPHPQALFHIWITAWTMTSYWYLCQYLHRSHFTRIQELHMASTGSISCHWVNIRLLTTLGGKLPEPESFVTYNDCSLDRYIKSCIMVYLKIFCEMISTSVTPHPLHWLFSVDKPQWM